jgi:SAM-dependent methyltransferase
MSIEVRWLLPSWKRLRRVFADKSEHSLLRCLEYERLAHLGLTGTVLDFGGGQRARYAARVRDWGAAFEYQSANIDKNADPMFLLAPGTKLPASDACYDAVLSLNTLEHVLDLDSVLAEIARVLKPSGRLIVIVPFVFRVHGHPDDYHRGTPSFWHAKLAANGFAAIAVEALNWGPFSTAQTVSGMPGPFKRFRQWLALVLDLVYAVRLRQNQESVVRRQDDPIVAAPIAYFIEARRT